jgi:hypothetical protein
MEQKKVIVDIADDGSNVYSPRGLEHINSLAEAVGHFYKDKIIQVYWGESGGTTNYSDFDISNNLFIEGKVLWGKGNVFALECEVTTPGKIFKTVVMFNDWQVYMVTPLDGVDLMKCFKGRIKKIKSQGLP